MAGVMSHEVTHAYRAHHGLRDSSIEDSAEELLTDVTSVYLGFGVLAANNSYRFRSSGSWNVQSWSWHKVGYLPPQAFAYLLALQVHSRRMGARERRAVFRHLEPNQAAFVREAYDSIADWEHMLFERLGMEDPGSRLNRVSPGEILKPLPAISPAGEQGRSEIPVYLKINQGKTISRVMRTRTDIGLGGGLILGFGVGVALSMVLGSVWLWMPILAIAMLAGWQWGRLQVYPTCSHPDCLAILREDASKCDRCGGRIEGETAPPRARR
jgi:hypothetical protein